MVYGIPTSTLFIQLDEYGMVKTYNAIESESRPSQTLADLMIPPGTVSAVSAFRIAAVRNFCN
jgi:hypothetical protein